MPSIYSDYYIYSLVQFDKDIFSNMIFRWES